jgi:hypothetical protein
MLIGPIDFKTKDLFLSLSLSLFFSSLSLSLAAKNDIRKKATQRFLLPFLVLEGNFSFPKGINYFMRVFFL